MIEDEACRACSNEHAARYEAENGRFRIFCVMCGHSTAFYPETELARLEWRLGRVAG